MAELSKHWVHGTAVQVEYADRVKSVRRAGWGTEIVQAPGTDNWVHFPFPTEVRADAKNWGYVGLHLVATVMDNATIDHVTCHFGVENSPARGWKVQLSGGTIEESFDLQVTGLAEPLVMCVHVVFAGSGDGKIVFHAGGVGYGKLYE